MNIIVYLVMDEALIAASAFVLEMVRGVQQQNITYLVWRAVPPTALVKAVAEVAVIMMAVKIGWSSIPWLALGGMIGVLASMRIKYSGRHK